jgi:hypothetical protein
LSRFRIFTLFAALVALATALAACGSSSSSDPQKVVDEATLQGIESGKLDLSVGVDVKGEKSGHVDVSLSGPFQKSEGEEELPELDLTAKANGSVGGENVDFEGGLTLLGNKAYVNYSGTDYEVDPTTFDFVKSAIKKQAGAGKQSGEGESGCQEAAGKLKVADFIENLSDEGSADVGGTSTTKVSGELDAPGAIEALTELTEDPACSEQLSAAGQVPSAAELGKAKGEVEEAVKEAHVDLYVGDDHIVRRITAKATIEPPKGSSNESGAKSVGLEIDLTLTGVNESQTISAPRSSKPLSDLFLKLGVNPIELAGALSGEGGGLSGGGLGGLLEGIGGGSGGSGGGSSSGGGGSAAGGGSSSSGGGQQAYLNCLKEAGTAADIQQCARLLQ